MKRREELTKAVGHHHSGPIAIHAAKKVDKDICLRESFRRVLAEYGYTSENLPTGAVVASRRFLE